MAKNEASRSLAASLLVHGVLVALMLLLIKSETNQTPENAIEISELIQSLKASPRAQVNRTLKTVPEAATRPSAQSSELQGQNSNAKVGETETSGSEIGEGIAEEYEVSSLPVPLNEVRVPFPAGARERGAQGAVVFLLTISSEGKVVEAVQVDSPDPELTRVAREALMKFKFKPAVLRDKAVAIKIRYTYRFVLQ